MPLALRSDSTAKISGNISAPALRRIDGIDVLRGLSIIAVIIHHINIRIPLDKTPVAAFLPKRLIDFLGWNGYNGVIVFFAISGFLITTTCFRRWQSLGRIRPTQFYRLRFARIAPLLLAVVAVLSILHLLNVPMYVIKPERASLPRAILAALTFHVNWLEAHRGFLPGNWDVMWSLSNEEMFYLFFPLVCVLTKTPFRLVALLAAFVVIGPVVRHSVPEESLWHDYGYLSAMDAIAVGCLAAMLCESISLSRRTGTLMQIVGAAFVIVVIFGDFW